MNNKNIQLSLLALKLIAMGLGVLSLLIASGILSLSIATVKAIALAIKSLNKWCDAQMVIESSMAIAGTKPIALLNPQSRVLITAAVLPSDGNAIALPIKTEIKSQAKKRGRPSKQKLAIA